MTPATFLTSTLLPYIFLSSYTNSPGWRPSFKYYNKWVSLFAAVVCVALMFVMDWRYAVGTVGCQILLGSYIYLRCALFKSNIFV